MSETSCGFRGDREDALIAYLYDDGHAIERASFEAHLDACAQCREELAELRGVRVQLAKWSAPSPEPAVVLAGEGGRQAWWQTMPAWAQVAAALLVLGVAAGLANLNVRYDGSGLTVRTGWMTPSSPTRTETAPERAARVDALAPVSVTPASAVTRSDLAALEQRLRAELRAVQPSSVDAHATLVRAGAPIAFDADTVRRIRAIVEQQVDASERRQQNELALRVGQVMRDVSAQRQADLVKIDRSFGYLQTNTSVEAMRQREALQRLNYIVNVSQKVPQ